MSYRQNTQTVAGALLRALRESPLTMLAAGIAYYAFVSLFPLLLLGIVVATTVGGEGLATAIVDQLGGFLSDSGEDLVRQTLTRADTRGGATLVGVAVLAWGGLKLFRGIDLAFSVIYGTRQAQTFLGQLTNAATALAAVGGAVGLTVAIGVAASLLGIGFAGVLGTVMLVVTLTAAFLPLYYIFPGVPISVRGALPGAVFAAVGWAVLQAGFRVYAASAGATDLYGIVGAVLLLVTWFYFGGLVLLLGAVVNGVLSGDIGVEVTQDRQLQQGSLSVAGQRAMSESGADDRDGGDDVEQLREELEALESRVDERTLHRDEVESDLKRYVRGRVRRGHARGWGPYLVLLYGTVMTVAGFYFLSGFWAFLSMIVIWLSTLGLYVVMVVLGITFTVLGIPGRVRDRIQSWRG